MACSCPPSNVGGDHFNPTVPQLIADLSASLTIEASIYLVASTTVNRRTVLGDLLIALTRKRCPQLMKTF